MSSSSETTYYDKPTGLMIISREGNSVSGKPDNLLKMAYQIIEAVRAQKAENPDPFFPSAPIDYLSV